VPATSGLVGASTGGRDADTATAAAAAAASLTVGREEFLIARQLRAGVIRLVACTVTLASVDRGLTDHESPAFSTATPR